MLPNSSTEQQSASPSSVYVTKPRVPTPKKPPSQQQKQESVPRSATPPTFSTEQPSAGPGSVYVTKPRVPTPKVTPSQQPTPKVPPSQQPTPKVPPSQQQKQQSGPGSAKPPSQQQKQQSGPGSAKPPTSSTEPPPDDRVALYITELDGTTHVKLVPHFLICPYTPTPKVPPSQQQKQGTVLKSATPPTSSTEQPPDAPGSVYVTKPRVPTTKTLPPHCPVCPYVPKELCPDASHQYPATSSPPPQPVSQPQQGSDAAPVTPVSVTSLDQLKGTDPRKADKNQGAHQSSDPRDPNNSVYLMPM